MKRAFSILLMTAVLLTCLPVPSHALDNTIVKIGLDFGNDAVPAAKLENADGGVGFQLGLYNAQTRAFRGVLTTDNSRITVMKNKVMYVNASDQYFDVKPSRYKYSIGCYHLQYPGIYDSEGAAKQAARKAQQSGYTAFPVYYNYKYYVRVGEFKTLDAVKEAKSGYEQKLGTELKIVYPSETCYTVAVTGTDDIIFQLDLLGTPLGVWPNGEQTKYNGWRYYGGLEFNRVNGNDITVISVVNMDQYVKGVIPYELSSSWPVEALKAQALCAKSYCYNNLGRHRSQGFDLCNTTDCQVYHGTNSATPVTDQLCDELSGQYVLYNGQVATTYYHSHSGGWTDDCINIWGRDIPYLKGKEDKWLTKKMTYGFSTTNEQLTSILRKKGYSLSADVVDFYVGQYSPYGNAMSMCFKLADGNELRFTADKARTAINSSSDGVYIGSHRYTILAKLGIFVNDLLRKGATNEFFAISGDGSTSTLPATAGKIQVITGDGVGALDAANVGYDVFGLGNGHQLGMSQWGAYGMAKEGMNHEDIIKYYFTGVTIGPRPN